MNRALGRVGGKPSALSGPGKVAVFAAAAVALAVCLFATARFIGFIGLTSGRGEPLRTLGIPAGEIPVTLTVYGRGADTLSMRLGFFGPSGEVLGTMERSWNGWQLTVDSVVVGTGAGWLVFPFRVYTDAPRSGNGLDLTRYYDRDGFPALWDQSRLTKGEIKALRAVFAVVLTERWVPRFLGSLHHQRLAVRNFEAGAEYVLSVLPDGSLELLRN